jgi:dipeptidyl aminopeptidase/acylaminoacyl peptidase
MRITFYRLPVALLLLCSAGTVALAAPASGDRVSLADVLSAPFPTDLTASPVDGRVVWVSNEKGVRNIMLAERKSDASFATRALTTNTRDNGYELDDLKWADGGTALAYTGGGSLEGGGPVNTESLASGPLSKEVFALRFDQNAPRNLGPGEEPTPSPVDGKLAFIRAGQIWLVDLKGTAAPTQLLHDRGSSSGLSWSPDGSKLAFLSHRKDGQTLLGVYDLASSLITWMSPSTDRDAAPQWSADGKRLAWVRIPATEGGGFRGFARPRAGPPWSIWTGDVASGAARPVWHADAGPGSVFKNVEDGTMLKWSADDRLVFPWEKTGWIRLYSISSKGGAPVALTPDGAEVFAAELDSAGTGLTFSSNATDDDHRHLWQVKTAGGALRELTKGESVEDLPAITKDGRVYALHSTGRDPLTPVAVAASGVMKPIYMPADSARFPSKAMVVPQRVVFKSPDGMEVHGQLFMPSGPMAGKRPAILFFHGGPQRQMLLGWHPMGAYTHLYAMNQYLASQGYIVLSVNFRGGTGYGLNWREPIAFAESGGSEVNDIAGAAAYLKSRPDVDAGRVGVYGMSYGGVMTSLALSKLPQEFVAGVDIAGVHDWKTFLPYLTEPGAPPERAALGFKSSAMGSVKDWRAPVLLIQGDDDRAVNFSQMIELTSALRAAGYVEPEQFVMPDEVHDYIRYNSWLSVFDKAQEFLARNVMNKR